MNALDNFSQFGYGVDLAFPEHQVAVDYIKFADSCERAGGRSALIDKLDTFERNGWKLLQVFEDEQINSPHIVESRILHALGLSQRVIYARKCQVRTDLPASVTRDFLNANHIQGVGRGANLYVGLEYQGELVAVMSVGHSRFNKKVDYELIRFATQCGTSIVGGASRLLAAVLRRTGSGSIISYADRRWSTGNLYRSLGFTEHCRSDPCYWYLRLSDTSKKYHRSSFQKHKLQDKLAEFDEELSEIENMRRNGWDRVFDSGNYVFIFDPK